MVTHLLGVGMQHVAHVRHISKNLLGARGVVFPKYESIPSHGDPMHAQTYELCGFVATQSHIFYHFLPMQCLGVVARSRSPGKVQESWQSLGVLAKSRSPGKVLESWQSLGVLAKSLSPGKVQGSWQSLGVLAKSRSPGKV